MKIALLGKYPPIQGGVSSSTFWCVDALAARGHDVHVVTNANMVEPGFKQVYIPGDEAHLTSTYSSGKVTVHNVNLIQSSYIPWAPPYLSQMFGLTMSVLEAEQVDLLIGWYFEPYALCATVAARLSNTPVLIRHAGSDVGRLMKHPDLSASYKWMIKQADHILTTPSCISRYFSDVSSSKLHVATGTRLPRSFSKSPPSFDFDAYKARSADWLRSVTADDELTREVSLINEKSLNRNSPTMLVYGKIGPYKSRYEINSALEALASNGYDFNYISLIAGTANHIEEYCRDVVSRRELNKRSWIFPPIPPWRIPALIQISDIVFCLENRFPIPFHNPQIPREVLSSGKCLICSLEIAQRGAFRDNFVNDKNVIIVDDPSDAAKLYERIEFVLKDSDLRSYVARHGKYLSDFTENELHSEDDVVRILDVII